jgi:Membrane bound O-acyl transferase family
MNAIYELNDLPRWLLMWLLAGTIFFACKVLTWSVATRAGVPLRRQLAYLFAWPGMDARRFFADRKNELVVPPSADDWMRGVVNVVSGAVIFWTAQHRLPTDSPLLLGCAGMIGIILMLHFGLVHLVSCYFRTLGIDAPPLMNRPMHASSVADFWGRRWNMAYRDLTYQFLFCPLRSKLGAASALLIGFAVSGINHDLVISIPAGGGYGGPTAYFVIQGVAILAEKSKIGRSLGLGHGLFGWLFAAVVLIAPVHLLFHDAFVVRVVVPFMESLGAA